MISSNRKWLVTGVCVAAVIAISFSFWPHESSVDTSATTDAGAGPVESNVHSRPTPDSDLPASPLDANPPLPTPATTVAIQDGDVVARWGEFVVFQEVARNCRNVLRYGNKATGKTHLNWICDYETVAAHPYAHFSTEQLRQIADTDGVAALILGLRLRDESVTIEEYQAAIQQLYTAVALTGEPDAYEILMSEQGIHIGTESNRPEEDRAEKSQAYVWAKAGNELGLIAAKDLHRAEQAIRAADPDAIDRLDSMASQLAEGFKQERVERTGEYF